MKTDDVDTYIAQFPKDIQKRLIRIRSLVKERAPDATESISYQMPTFKLNGKNLVHFAAWKSHIGFYPTPSGTEKFQKQLTKYTYAKGSIQFPLDQPLPIALIKRIVAFRVKENREK